MLLFLLLFFFSLLHFKSLSRQNYWRYLSEIFTECLPPGGRHMPKYHQNILDPPLRYCTRKIWAKGFGSAQTVRPIFIEIMQADTLETCGLQKGVL
jgi:hypothetical protein